MRDDSGCAQCLGGRSVPEPEDEGSRWITLSHPETDFVIWSVCEVRLRGLELALTGDDRAVMFSAARIAEVREGAVLVHVKLDRAIEGIDHFAFLPLDERAAALIRRAMAVAREDKCSVDAVHASPLRGYG